MGVALPEEHLPPVPVISDEDLGTLLRSMTSTAFLDRRDTAIVRLMLDTGVRREELVSIDVDDLDLRQQEVALYRTKGGRPASCRSVVGRPSRYAATSEPREHHPAAGSPALFVVARMPEPGSSWRMSGDSIWRMLRRRCEAAGLATIHPHQFRHTWADDLLSNGANEGDVERLAGWQSPLMVRRYGRSAADRRARDSARRLARGDRV